MVLGDRKPLKGRPGKNVKALNFNQKRKELAQEFKKEIQDDDLFSYLMYPQVYAGFVEKVREFSRLSVLPTPAFFYGMSAGEEIEFDIEEGKTLFVKLVNIGDVDRDGYRTLTFELNGMTRELRIQDRSVKAVEEPRAKADPADKGQIGAPIPGVVTALAVSVGAKVKSGDKLLTLEAMKMQSTVYSATDGVVQEIGVKVGDNVDAKDLLIRVK